MAKAKLEVVRGSGNSVAKKHIVILEYPPLMHSSRMEGTIKATAVIKPDGAVGLVEYLGDHNFRAFQLASGATTKNLLKWQLIHSLKRPILRRR